MAHHGDGILSIIAAGPVNAFVPLIVAVGFQVGVFKTLLYLSPGGIFIGLCILATTYLAYKVKDVSCYIIFVAQMFTLTAALLYRSCQLLASAASSSLLATSYPGSLVDGVF